MTIPTVHDSPKGVGWIEVIAGCMFSGKTEELIRRVRRAQIARQTVAIIKPKIDTRHQRGSDRLSQRRKIPRDRRGIVGGYLQHYQ